MALGAKEFADFIVEFGRERTFANTGGVRLGNAENITDCCRTKTRTGSCLTGNRIGRGDERIGAVVVIEQCTLRTFEKNASASLTAFIENAPDLINVRQDLVGNRSQLFKNGLNRDFFKTHAATQQVVMGEQTLNLWLQCFRLSQVDNADCTTANLVFVSRANTSLGRADLEAFSSAFAHSVKFAMNGENQRSVFRNAQHVRRDFDALTAQFLNFHDKMMRINHNTIADHAQLAAHKAGWQKRKLVADAIDDKRMTRVMTALIAHNHIGALGQPVHDLSLALIAPLRPDDNYIRH